MSFIYSMTDTWNDIGTTFTAIKMNVTNTASAAASMLMDLQVGGSSVFQVRKDGSLLTANNASTLGLSSAIWQTLFVGTVAMAQSGNTWSGGILTLNTLSFNSGGAASLTTDAANTIAQRNGTTAQKFRVYNTFTDASNGEWLELGFSINVPYINSTVNGTGAQRGLLLNQNSWIKGVVMTLTSLSASVATAAAAGTGARAYITDITTATRVFGVTAVGGGTLGSPVFSDGTQWLAG